MSTTNTNTNTPEQLSWNFGGLVAYVFPIDHDHMVLYWELLTGQVFMGPVGQRTICHNVKTAKQFKSIATEFYADLFADDTDDTDDRGGQT